MLFYLSQVTENELVELSARSGAQNKIDEVMFIKQLPKTLSGKVNAQVVKDIVLNGVPLESTVTQ